ncbi:metal ABC transporter solute-binding protein, Zn/Mn family [Nesterenkonia sp. NBAIMH1]|uniref:metal ABC transporter solute-binding protein, Zn/Mn family n=1 Tax=Nesterenkonia sp. NBAIMH1 TaxID=2600320 RepID=UPI0011B380A9|nr:zinc ABC transporter substrate-binding protein [Nesterenkonia sp. NBAIMH1]
MLHSTSPARCAPRAAVPAALLASALTVTSCAGEDGSEADSQNPLVLTTFSVLEDITAHIADDAVQVQSITPVGAEVHEYDPSPSDVAAASDADLVIENGLGLEEWFDQFIAQGDAPVVTATDGIDAHPITRVPGHPDDQGDSAEMPTDPHAWLSPEKALTYVDNIEAALADLVPEEAELFEDNADELRGQLEELSASAQERAQSVGSEIFVVSCEGAFSYAAEDLGLTEHYLWPLNAEDEGSPQQVEAQIEFVQTHDVDTIFCESTVNDGPQRQVAEATGAQLGETLYVDSLTEADGVAPTYLDLLEHNMTTILEAAE